MKGLLRILCFGSFGICTFYSPIDPFNLYRLGFGIIFGLLFGFLFRKFLNGFLGIFNHKFKKEQGKVVIKNAVKTGMLFMIPFTIMLLLATFYLNWSQTAAFISAGIMAVGTASAIEMGKQIGKSSMKNTIATSGVCFLFSFTWTLLIPFMIKVPSFLEAGVGLVKNFITQGGVGI